MPFLLLALLVVPFLELYVIIQVGQEIGVLQTIALLLLDSVLGAWLVRREGRRAWQALQQALNAGKAPTKQLVDGALVLIGGTLLLTPGFATDLVGFFLLLPFTRPLARRALLGFFTRRLAGAVAGPGIRIYQSRPGPRHPGEATTPESSASGGRVIGGEVVEDDEDR